MTDDVRLPENWSKGSRGGPAFNTPIVPLLPGTEKREQRWLYAKQRYEIAHNIKSPEDIMALNAFFRARRGARYPFLFKDWVDYSSAANGIATPAATDCPLGTGTGAQTTFQLVKRYADTVRPYDRPILWPVTGTLVVAVNGAPLGSGFSVARGTGIVTFSVAPSNGAVLTAGFQFDVPVRFEDDYLDIAWDTINSRSAGTVPLIEVRGE